MAAKPAAPLSPAAAVSALTCIQVYGEGPSECGYCGSTDKRLAFGVMCSKGAMPAVDYQALIDVGWRRSGCYLYRPNNSRTCCPNITIKLDCTRFEMNKAQRRVLRRFDAYLRGEALDAPEPSTSSGSSSSQKPAKRPSQSSTAPASELPLFAFIGGLLIAAAEQFVDHLRKGSGAAAADDTGSKEAATEAAAAADPTAAALDAALAAIRASSGTAVAAAPPRAPAPPLCGCRPQLASSLALKLYGLLKVKAPGGAAKASAAGAGSGAAPVGARASSASTGPASLASPAAVAEALLRHAHDVYAELIAGAAAGEALGAEATFVAPGADASAAASDSIPVLRLTPPPACLPATGVMAAASSAGSAAGTILLSFAPSGHINIALPDGGTVSLPSGEWCSLPAPTGTPAAAVGSSAGTSGTSVPAPVASADGISPAAAPPSAKRSRSAESGAPATEPSATAADATPAAGGAGKGSGPKPSAAAPAAMKPLKPRTFTVTTVPAAFTAESYALYKRYQMAVHGDKPTECTDKQYTRFLCDNPLIREPFPPTAPTVLRTPIMAAEEAAAAAAAARESADAAAGGAASVGAASSSAPASAPASVTGFWAEPRGQALNRCVKGLAAAWRDGEGPGAGLPLTADEATAGGAGAAVSTTSSAAAAAGGGGAAPPSVVSSPAEFAFPALRLPGKAAAPLSADAKAAGGAGTGAGAPSSALSTAAAAAAAGVADADAAAQHGADLRFGYGAFHQLYRIDGKLVAVGVVDILPNCLSSVYVFYDPELSRTLELGKLTALWEIAWVQRAMAVSPRLKHYYLGYYIRSCPKMRYKVNRHHDTCGYCLAHLPPKFDCHRSSSCDSLLRCARI